MTLGSLGRVVACAAALLLGACNKDDTGGADDTGSGEQQATTIDLTPSVGGLGTTMKVKLYASRSTFRFGATSLNFGDAITVDSVTVDDNYQASALVTIDPDADLGRRDVTVTVEGRDRVLEGAFTVVTESLVIDPPSAKMGETLSVAIVGTGTAWTQGYTWASFGDGIEVLDFRVVSETVGVAQISVAPDATPGFRDVAVEDGPHVVTLYDGFTVDRAVITAFWDPPVIEQGETIPFRVTGLDTAFDDDTVITFYDAGGPNADLQIQEMTVLDATNIIGRVQASNAARIGFRDVLITTQVTDVNGDPATESLLIPDGIQVLDAPPDLTNVIPGIGFDVYRDIDNATGETVETVFAYAIFVIPLDPPCGPPPVFGSGPRPYDANGVFPVPPDPPPVDCPDPETVSAGDYVWFEGPENIVTMVKDIDPSNGQIRYLGQDLTLDDYHFDQLYDLHAQGDPNGLPEFLIERVQPTVPADYHLLTPDLWGDYTISRAAPFNYTWTPARTYPDAIFGTSINGTLSSSGEPGFAGSLPWDDGDHTYQPFELALLSPGTVSFQAYSYVEGPVFGIPGSTVQTAQSDSIVSTTAVMNLE